MNARLGRSTGPEKKIKKYSTGPCQGFTFREGRARWSYSNSREKRITMKRRLDAFSSYLSHNEVQILCYLLLLFI